MHAFTKPIVAAFAFAIVASLAVEASAAEVRAAISTRETYVGLPVTLQIQVRNAEKFDAPALPEVAGLKIESLGTPGRSTQTTIINGRVSTNSSVIYSYQVTPTQTGSFHIPPITVTADGEQLATPAFDFVASKSETGDLLFVEISGKEKDIYVGQSLDLQLKIWVRPYQDKQYNVTLSEGDMWHLLSERTNWGPFAEQIQQLAARDQRPVGTEVLRKDRNGVEHSYYLYEIPATIYPKKPGKIDAKDVQVVALYPTAIGESQDPFGGMLDDMGFGGRMGSMFGPRLAIESVHPIVAEAQVDPIEVREIPIADRPADYRGAVGKYRIVSQANETNVKAGDPITLLLGVAGTGPMDLVQAPPLAELPALTRDFKVPNEPLAGYVKGVQKVFQTTIRPRLAGITEIPPIPFSYFDPEIGKFITTESAPIPIHVAPADTLALADVVGRSAAAGATSDDASQAGTADAGPQLAIATTGNLLAKDTPPQPLSNQALALLAVPPLAVLVLLIFRSPSGFSALALRFGTSLRRSRVQIEAAENPADIARALRTILTKRLRLSATADAATIVGALRSTGRRTAAVRTERILQQAADANVTALSSGPTLDELKREALAVLDDLQGRSRPAPLKPIATRLQTSTSTIIAIVALAGALFAGNGSVQAATTSNQATLTTTQQNTLLTEAGERYNAALSTAATDSAEAKEAFADAAEKYQLVVDSGVENSRLYFNLANAYLESGTTGRAIANYERSLRLDPTNRDSRTNLAYAQGRLAKPAADAKESAVTRSEYASLANSFLNRYVSPTAVLTIATIAWLAFWVALGARLCDLRFPWKSLAVASLLIAVTAAASYALSCQAADSNVAVVVNSDAPLRTGDGDSFPAVGSTQLAEGQSVEFLKRRSGWVQIKTEQGDSGWLPAGAVEVL
jgi:tetratricopeptide (TPR) repeat protein